MFDHPSYLKNVYYELIFSLNKFEIWIMPNILNKPNRQTYHKKLIEMNNLNGKKE
jgi:hypothetical protein